jgi:hypothetical protein
MHAGEPPRQWPGPHQEDVTLACVGTAAPGDAVTFHGIKDALNAQRGWGGSNFIVSIDFRYKRRIASKEATASTLGVHRFEQVVNKGCIHKGGQRAALGYPAMHGDRWGQAAVETHMDRAVTIVKGADSKQYEL